MKNRKKSCQQDNEKRNALYHKVILKNKDLSIKNTELSHKINILENKCIAYEKALNGSILKQIWNWIIKLIKLKKWKN